MDDKDKNNSRRCNAMTEEGIENPESAEGIMFCAGNKFTESKCPYPTCVVFEYDSSKKATEAKTRRKAARDLRGYGVSTKDIALILGRSLNTIKEYLRRR